MISDELIKWTGFWASVLALVSAVVSLAVTVVGFYQRKKEEKRRSSKIYLQLLTNKERVTIPSAIRREHLRRSEVLGILGGIPMKLEPEDKKQERQKRFSITSIGEAKFLADIDDAYRGDVNKTSLVINCSDKELMQFDRSKMKSLGFVFKNVNVSNA